MIARKQQVVTSYETGGKLVVAMHEKTKFASQNEAGEQRSVIVPRETSLCYNFA